MSKVVSNILLIEDNPADADLAIRILGGCDYSPVTHLKDGEQAISYLFGSENELLNIKLPCVIFLDLKLPKVNGHEVLLRIKSDERLKMIPVVVLTSSNEEHDVNTSYQLGANSYVVKPIAYPELKKAISETCDYWLKRNRSAPALAA